MRSGARVPLIDAGADCKRGGTSALRNLAGGTPPLPSPPPHVRVSKVKHMNANVAGLLYLLAGVLFILALRGLSSPVTSAPATCSA